jgi:hypothetical protein
MQIKNKTLLKENNKNKNSNFKIQILANDD